MLTHAENLANVQLYTLGADIPTWRGTFKQTYGAEFAPAASERGYESIMPETTGIGRTATRKEKKLMERWDIWRKAKGLPVWCGVHSDAAKEFWEDRTKGKRSTGVELVEPAPMDPEAGEVEYEATPALKEWCERYTADPGLLKEFRLLKGIWGWDLAGLTAGLSTRGSQADS